jgi:RNA ligase (TIGR02306 family)
MLATVEVIKSITPHPNADALDFVEVLGYKCITKKGLYQVGDKVILIQPDTVLPDAPWAEVYKKFSSSRVKAQKLRGEWSFGIVESLSLLTNPEKYVVGEEVSEILGITKYDPPLPEEIDAIGILPFNIRQTKEETYQNLNLEEFINKQVDVTLKVDGFSISYYYYKGNVGVLGRKYEIDSNADNLYTKLCNNLNIFNKLEYYCKKNDVNLAIRGELYGPGIQKRKHNPHSKLDLGVKFYNVYLIDEYEYAGLGHQHYFRNVCEELGLPTVDIIESNVLLTPELINKYDEGLTEILGHPFEGVVIKGADFSFKVINKYYDSKK